jgi:uncharacterized protein YidB (DUF937 family)
MGLLDQIAQQVLGGTQAGSGPQLSGLAQAVMGMLGDQQRGGLPELVQAFQRSGLGDVMASWISTGQNLPISGAQLQQALGSERIGQLAQQAGLSADQGLGALVQLLPSLIDKLTPDGKLPQQSQLASVGASLLKSLLT